MEKEPGKIFREVKDDLKVYAELKLELLKLSAYEKGGKIISHLSYDLLLMLLAFFATLFIFLAIGFYLGELLQSMGAGFAVVAILYMLLIGIIMKNRKHIQLKIMNVIISALTANDDKDDKDKDDKEDTHDTTNRNDPADAAGEADF